MISGSGDGTAHVWSIGGLGGFRLQSSEEEGESDEEEGEGREGEGTAHPLMVLSGHSGVVVSADWVAGVSDVILLTRFLPFHCPH